MTSYKHPVAATCKNVFNKNKWVNYSLGVHKKIGARRSSKASKEILGVQRVESGVQKIVIVKMRIL